MQEKGSRTRIVAVIGTYALSLALAASTVAAPAKERRRAQMRPSSQQEMTDRSQKAMADRVEMRLARSSTLAGSDINVAVRDRTVSLSGTVGSERDKERAVRLAHRVRGVKKVKENLSIDPEAVDKRRAVQVGDAELAEQVAKKLASVTFPWATTEQEWRFGWEVDGYRWEVDVNVDGGVVTLEGRVDSHRDITQTVEDARSVPGVRAVVSRLRSDLYNFSDYPYPYLD